MLRATNENTYGLLRPYVPKRTDLRVHAPEHLRVVEERLNPSAPQGPGRLEQAEAVTRYQLLWLPGNRLRVAADWCLDAVLSRQRVQLGLVGSPMVPLETAAPELPAADLLGTLPGNQRRPRVAPV